MQIKFVKGISKVYGSIYEISRLILTHLWFFSEESENCIVAIMGPSCGSMNEAPLDSKKIGGLVRTKPGES
jgi:hypothetical protein